MNCQRINGEPQVQPFKKKASTALAVGQVVALDSNGFLIPAVAATTATDIVGICMETVLSTDADYASTRDVGVDTVAKGGDNDRFLMVVGTGTAAQSSVGESHDLGDDGLADLSATTTKVIKVERFISAALVWVSFLNTDAIA
jgi:hypothetical protein